MKGEKRAVVGGLFSLLSTGRKKERKESSPFVKIRETGETS